MKDIVEKMNADLGEERVVMNMFDQYYNMREVIEKDMTVVDLAKKAMENLDIAPVIYPVRGGTDGSKISFMGLPTPNLLPVAKTCMRVTNTFQNRLWKKLRTSCLKS